MTPMYGNIYIQQLKINKNKNKTKKQNKTKTKNPKIY